MRSKFSRFIGWLVLIGAVSGFVWLGQTFFFRNMDSDQRRIEGFYMEPSDSLDVVFLGSSELFTDFSSALAYEDFGFTSYPYAVNANPVTLWKYELQEIIDRQHPQLIVVETNGALYDRGRLFREVSLRRIVDNIPSSRNRTAMIKAFGHDSPISYVFPFVKYHNKWEQPSIMMKCAASTISLYLRQNAYLKGVLTNTGKLQADSFRDIRGDAREAPLQEDAESALRDFLEYCRTEKIDNIIFVRYPHCVTEADADYARYLRSNAAGTIISSYGFDFINLDQYEEEIGFDLKNDYYNSEHMNIYGMQKMTKWFGSYLMDHYHLIPRQQTEKNIRQWENSVRYMHAFEAYFEELKSRGTAGGEINESYKVIEIIREKLE